MPAPSRRLTVAAHLGPVGRRRPQPPQQRLDTFDVFETVLVRAVSPPQAVFLLVGQRARGEGLLTCSAHAFDKARQAAERRASRARGDERDLTDIYAELGGALGLPEAAQRRLAELELTEEAAQLRPLPSGAALVARSRADTGRVVYVSDMYLPAEFIQQQLERHGLWQAGDALYVSLSHGCTKHGGGLFAVVAAAEDVPVAAITHHGNHVHADVRGAQRAGAVPVLLADGNPNRFEQALERHRDATDGFTAAMSGASRLARLEQAPTSGRERALIDVAAGVMAPVLTDYVLWLLRRAQALGLARLYFVARDGQVLLRIAERLAPRIGCDVELRYLYASRLVWNRVVSGPSRNPQVWNSLVGLSCGGIGNREVLERTGIGPDEVERVVAASGLDAERWRSATDRTVLLAALEQVESDGTLAAAAARNKALVLRHLEQEGLLDDVPHGFVDVGWRGTQHDALVELQTERGALTAHGLFFGLDRSTSPWGHLREAYFFDSRQSAGQEPDAVLPLGGSSLPRTRLGTPLGPADFALVEVFCSGDEGTVTDLVATAEGVVPVLAPGRRAAVEAWGLPLVWRTVDSYVRHLPVTAEQPFRHLDVQQSLAEVMNLFWQWPTRQEAAAWSQFPWEIGQGARQRTIPLAPGYRLSRLAADVARPPSPFGLRQALRSARASEWYAASLVGSSVPANLVLRPRGSARHAVRRSLRRLRRTAASHPLVERLRG